MVVQIKRFLAAGPLLSISLALLLVPSSLAAHSASYGQEPAASYSTGDKSADSAAAQPEPQFNAIRYEGRTIIHIANWTATPGSIIVLNSSAPISRLIGLPEWNISSLSPYQFVLKLEGSVARPAEFIAYSNLNSTYTYQLTAGSYSHSGILVPELPSKQILFSRWLDPKEGAASAYIPLGWKADLDIIRPYRSMTGFVFEAREDATNTLLYVFAPFMPLHIIPTNSWCATSQLCGNGEKTITAEQSKQLSIGSAPVIISSFTGPHQYFSEEVLPVLQRNLNSYVVESATDVTGNYTTENGSSDQHTFLDVKYSFDAEGKKIDGVAAVYTQNHTRADIGFWNGYIVGIESREGNFSEALQKSLVTLLTLKFDSRWLANEQATLDSGADTVLHENDNKTAAVMSLLANTTLGDSSMFALNSAKALALANSSARVSAFAGSNESQMALPISPYTRHWYISEDGTKLMGRSIGRTPEGYSELGPA